MARKNPRSRRTDSSTTPPRRVSNRADPVSRLARFCELAALGLVAASGFMQYPDDLNRADMPHISLDYFKPWPLRAAVTLQHTRAVWITLAVISVIAATAWFRTRLREPRSKIVAFSPLAILLVIGLHATALGYLAHQGFLVVESSTSADDALGPITFPIASASTSPSTTRASPPTLSTTAPATTAAAQSASPEEPRMVITSIRRLKRLEGTAAQWQLFAAGDALFSAPVTIAWTLSLLIARLRRKGVDLTGKSA